MHNRNFQFISIALWKVLNDLHLVLIREVFHFILKVSYSVKYDTDSMAFLTPKI